MEEEKLRDPEDQERRFNTQLIRVLAKKKNSKKGGKKIIKAKLQEYFAELIYLKRLLSA